MRAFAVVTAWGLWVVLGCVSVDPRPDYKRARALITQATGSADVYDPISEDLIEDRVQTLIEDGLTVDESVQIVLLNNKGFQALFQEIGASRADVVQSGLLSNPNLGLSLRFPEGGGRSDLTVGFAQQIADFWQIPVRKQVAEAELEQVILTAADRAVGLSADVKSAYYQAAAAERAESLAQENINLVSRSVDVANARWEGGEVGLVDVNLVRTSLISVQLDGIAARRRREEATNRLLRLLGLARSRITFPLTSPWPDSATSEIDDDKALLAAAEHRFDAAVAALRVKAAQAELERQYLNVFPNVTLGMEGERPESRSQPGRTVARDTAQASIAAGTLTAPSIQSRSERRREKSQIIDLLLGPTLDITLPLWDQNQAQIAKAGYRVRQLRAAYEDVLDNVLHEVTEALSALRFARDLAQFYEDEALPHAEQSVRAASETYKSGEQSVLALIEAQEALIAQRRAQVDAVRDLAVAQAELERAMGGVVLPDPMETPPQPGDASPQGD